MPILYLANAADGDLLRKPYDVDWLDELMEAFNPQMPDLDSRHATLTVEALDQCQFIVDPERAGTWVVHDETEQRWLLNGLTALSEALARNGFPFTEEGDPDPAVWLRYYCRQPVVLVDPSVATRVIDLGDHADWITGKCRFCGVTTEGLEDPDEISAADIEHYDAQAASGDWICADCEHHLCGDCGERLCAPGDPECCAQCRAEREHEKHAQP